MQSDLLRIATDIGQKLLQRQETLAVVESCTGGLLAKQLTDVAGSSAWFDRGLITYSNQAKQSLLGVPPELIDTHGAVSEACVTAMAEGLLHNAPVDWCIAITGIAGPGGGTPDKPVGTVWMAWQRRGQAAERVLQLFPGDREGVRERAVTMAMQGLLGRLVRASRPQEEL